MSSITINISSSGNQAAHSGEFTIVETLPHEGGSYKGMVVLEVNRVGLDPEQPLGKCFDYDCFVVTLRPAQANGDDTDNVSLKEYVAISNVEPNHLKTLIHLPVLVPSITEANAIIGHFLDRAPELNKEIALQGIEQSELVQQYFGISPERFRNLMLAASQSHFENIGPLHDGDAGCYGGRIVTDPSGIRFCGLVPYWWDNSFSLEITEEEIRAQLSA